jgi:hypothetical protein
VQTIEFGQAIIAAGSQSVKLPFMPDDERVVDSTGALLLRNIPKKMLIVGGGIIGLEMGTVYSALGSRLDVVEMQDGLMQGADRDLVKVWQKKNAHRFDNLMLNTKTVGAVAKKDGIYVTFEGAGAPKEAQRYDLVLQAVGRTPNGKKIGADKAGRSWEKIDRPQLVVCSVHEDRTTALDMARMMVTQYLGQQPHIMKASGVPQSLLDKVGEVLTWPATHEQVEAASKLVPDEIVQMLTASGTPDEARAKVREYIKDGATCPILYPLGDVTAMIDAFAGWTA